MAQRYDQAQAALLRTSLNRIAALIGAPSESIIDGTDGARSASWSCGCSASGDRAWYCEWTPCAAHRELGRAQAWTIF